MTAFEVIQQAAKARLTNEDGEPVVWSPLPGLTDAAIAALEGDLGCKLPTELRALLLQCAGVEGPLESIDFTGRVLAGLHSPAFPRALPIAHDGSGNFWVIDVGPTRGEVAPIYFAGHDPPVILYQADSIAAFLLEVARMDQPPHESLIDDVREAEIGMGFSWGRHGPRTIVRRHGDLPIFAYAPPLKRTLWATLIGD